MKRIDVKTPALEIIISSAPPIPPPLQSALGGNSGVRAGLPVLTLVLLAGCATTPGERLIRAWHFEPGHAELPGGEFTRVADHIHGASVNVAAAVRTKDGSGLVIHLPVEPPLPVGSTTKLRFQCRVSGAGKLTVQMFDLTVEDNRHIELQNLPADSWHSLDLDFTRDARRNDGTHDNFGAGHRVDGVFFFIHNAAPNSGLWVDDVVLYSPEP